MKIALINPSAKRVNAGVEPLSLGYIAGYLEQNGIDVRIIDQVAGDDINRQINAYKPDIVGITSMAHMVIEAYRIADICRRKGILTVMGGVHPSAMPQEALEHADVVVVGEGEKAMLDIVKNRTTSGIVSRPYTENIDELPMPHWRLMKQDFYAHAHQLKQHIFGSLGHKVAFSMRSASVLTSRGCPFRCIFCLNSLRQSPVRFHSAERVLDEVRRLKTDYGIEAIVFLDENLLVNKPRLEKICRAMTDEKLNILWCCGASAHFIDRRTATMIKEAGCRLVAFGIESGSQRILDVLGKTTTVEQNKEAIRVCKEAGLLVHASFMLGNPGETLEDVRLTQKFILETQPEVFYVNITTPYPGTKLWELYNEKIPRPINWRGFNSSKSLDVYAYTPFGKAELGKLFIETVLIRPAVYYKDWRSVLRYFKGGVRWFLWHPFTAAKFILYVIRRNIGKKQPCKT
ncbi:MAG: radical SAM protein [Candidatus Omnitrophica bacterium]|nr:radical SAM protein [Candidatus Omnitrophota bacterium]